jgi:hypothetical protein
MRKKVFCFSALLAAIGCAILLTTSMTSKNKKMEQKETLHAVSTILEKSESTQPLQILSPAPKSEVLVSENSKENVIQLQKFESGALIAKETLEKLTTLDLEVKKIKARRQKFESKTGVIDSLKTQLNPNAFAELLLEEKDLAEKRREIIATFENSVLALKN